MPVALLVWSGDAASAGVPDAVQSPCRASRAADKLFVVTAPNAGSSASDPGGSEALAGAAPAATSTSVPSTAAPPASDPAAPNSDAVVALEQPRLGTAIGRIPVSSVSPAIEGGAYA